MNPTQNQNHTPQTRRGTDGPAGWLAGLLTDGSRFRTRLAAATTTAAQPVSLGEVPHAAAHCENGGQPHLGPCVEAPGTAARVLQSAAVYLERHGWIQGAYYDSTTGSFAPPACLVGAIAMVCYGGPVDAPAQHFDDPGFLDFEAAVLHLDRYLLAEDGSESYDFNDARGRTADQVTEVLRNAAARPAHELIDAIRAIDAKNAANATLAELVTPGGIWANSVPASSDGGVLG